MIQFTEADEHHIAELARREVSQHCSPANKDESDKLRGVLERKIKEAISRFVVANR